MDVVTKEQYLKLIRKTVIINSFLEQYFIRLIVIYLLHKGVTPWVAVSIPVVIEFARTISRAIKPLLKFAISTDFKKFNFIYLFLFVILSIIISNCTSVYTIYLFSIISGLLIGIKNSAITKINTQNPRYESYCFFEEERSFTIGGTLGLITSQALYNIDSNIYLICFIFFGILGLIINLSTKNIKIDDKDYYDSEEETGSLTKKEKLNIWIITTLYSSLVGFWGICINGFQEVTPLITDKAGYLTALYTSVELAALFIINGTIIKKIKKRKKALLVETIVAIFDCIYLFIAANFKNLSSLVVVYFLCGISSTLGDPLWGSIISSYSENNRKKYIKINSIYFAIRACFTLISLIVCRQCVIGGINSFKYLALFCMLIIVGLYFVANEVNKKIFKNTI